MRGMIYADQSVKTVKDCVCFFAPMNAHRNTQLIQIEIFRVIACEPAQRSPTVRSEYAHARVLQIRSARRVSRSIHNHN